MSEPFKKPAHKPCNVCGSVRLWESVSGVVVCGVCHPAACEGLILRWIDVEEANAARIDNKKL